MYNCHGIEWFDEDKCLICEQQSKKLNKYFWRRLLVGAIATPLVGLAYVLFCAVLIGLGAEPTDTPQGYFFDGVMLGVIATVMFALYAVKGVKEWMNNIFGF